MYLSSQHPSTNRKVDVLISKINHMSPADLVLVRARLHTLLAQASPDLDESFGAIAYALARVLWRLDRLKQRRGA
jgi:hypothetical protein